MLSLSRRPRRNVRAARPGEEGDGLWQRPLLLNLLADLMFAGAAAVLSYAAVSALQRLPVFPLHILAVAQAPQRVAVADIERAAAVSLHGNFFTVDLAGVRDAFEQLPWVRRADVRRVWPDGVAVTIEEQVAAARWRPAEEPARLVNSFGEVFAGSERAAELPALSGPDDSAALLLSQYREFAQALAPLGLRPQALAMTPRRAWQMRLDDGLIVELGRDLGKDTLSERLGRFVSAYAEARQRLPGSPDRVDLRYPNGFALHVPHAGVRKS